MGRPAKGTDKRPEYRITALARGLAVLDAFGPHRRELALRDVAEAAGVTQPSALRIGFTLIEAGYLVRNPSTKGYRLGPRALSVGLATLSAMTLPELAEPYLVALRDRTDETIKLAIPTGPEVVVVARVPSLSYPSTTTYIGSRMPATISSLGRAILAWEEPDVVAEIVRAAKPARLTGKSVRKDRLAAELAATRARGYSLNDQGTTIEHRSVGAPILDTTGHPVASVNLSVSVQRVSLPELEGRLAPEVVRTAAEISALLPPQVQGAGRLSHLA
ncbi:IclR family transcriptional regulator [Kutzneria sp. CA-103260]|uniref:IclR family transcriptional regulator n=1 Tax=Kutzneria sp. CA-103260 TaxID=2802641 RepID=UPI001BA61B03|nr:IclR family transcriptional regulator [Kutzneria sp. CA-103260]QUQ64365.1 IclR family transcriptional regulator [Kutzneria sp. CA-103260]